MALLEAGLAAHLHPLRLRRLERLGFQARRVLELELLALAELLLLATLAFSFAFSFASLSFLLLR